MPNRTLLFVRHGQYLTTTPPGAEPDGPLTELGIQQATLAARRLQNVPARVIYHSTLRRAEETARIIANALPEASLVADARLRECIPCVPPGFGHYFTHIPPEFIASGAEQARQAYLAYLQPLANGAQEQVEIIVSHGNLINYFASQAVGAPVEAWINFDLHQCGISEITISPAGWVKLVRHNDTGHLPPDLRSYL